MPTLNWIGKDTVINHHILPSGTAGFMLAMVKASGDANHNRID